MHGRQTGEVGRALAAMIVAALLVNGIPASGLAQTGPRLEESRRLASEAIAAYRDEDFARFEAKTDSALALRPNHPSFAYNLAAARALGADTAGAVGLLDRLANWGLAYDPAGDPDFERLSGAASFEAVRARLLANGRARGSASRAIELEDREMLPEALARDAVTGNLFLASVRRRSVVRIAPDGTSAAFIDGAADGMPAPLGMVADAARRALWVSGTRVPESEPSGEDSPGMAGPEAEVREYDLDTGRLRRVLAVPVTPGAAGASDEPGLAAGDIALEPAGSVLVSDWRTGALLRGTLDSDTLAVVLPPGSLGSPQGIVPAPGGRSALIADYSLGLVRVDLESGAVHVVEAPTTLLGSDALLDRDGDLIVVQNGVSPARVLRLELSADRSEVTDFAVLLAAHPDFSEPTGAVLAGDALLLVANGQWSHFSGGEVRRQELSAPVVLEVQELLDPLAIRGAWLWDGVTMTGQSDHTVVVRTGRIAAVGPRAEVEVPAGVQVIDGEGLFLIPGLWDMHVHALWAADVPPSFLPLFLASGVTGVRDMGGVLDVLRQTRDDLRRGRYPGPRLVTAGMILDGPQPVHPDVSLAIETADDARLAVERLHRAEVDFLKVYTLLPAAAFDAVIEESRARSLPVAGHVPAAVGPIAAAEAGMRSVEHTMNELGGFCPREEPAACEEIFRTFRLHGTWQVPALVIEREQSKEQMVDDPRLGYMPASVLAYWFDDAERARRSSPTLTSDLYPEEVSGPPEEIWLARALHRARVAVLAGSDTGVPFSFPGWSLHEELELLVEAGLRPAEALVAATRAPAEYLDREGDLGTIEVGKRADLVLLRENPLDDIRNTRTIEAVIRDGTLLDREALDQMLADVQRLVE